ncbi:acyl-ACP--UDP-N-acetylglucosamine O-acyltransferase [Paracoccaceae bacterium GXU_MW_L88]
MIHESAVIHEGAEIGDGVEIGPFCVVGPQVRLADGVKLHSHVVVEGRTVIGEKTRIFPFASIGHEPQDLKFAGEDTRLEVGARNTIREYVTMNPGTEGGGGLTRVGDGNLFMMGVHVGHDCMIGNGCVLANYASLGGHSIIEDQVVIGALAGVHQFCRIGQGAMIGGLAAVAADVIPYGSVVGERAHLAGLNLVGLKRRGAPREEMHQLRHLMEKLFSGDGTVKSRAEALRGEFANTQQSLQVIDFILAETDRHLTTPQTR